MSYNPMKALFQNSFWVAVFNQLLNALDSLLNPENLIFFVNLEFIRYTMAALAAASISPPTVTYIQMDSLVIVKIVKLVDSELHAGMSEVRYACYFLFTLVLRLLEKHAKDYSLDSYLLKIVDWKSLTVSQLLEPSQCWKAMKMLCKQFKPMKSWSNRKCWICLENSGL